MRHWALRRRRNQQFVSIINSWWSGTRQEGANEENCLLGQPSGPFSKANWGLCNKWWMVFFYLIVNTMGTRTLALMKKTETKNLVWWQSGRPRTLFVDDRANLALACLGSSNLPTVTTMTMMTMMLTMIMRALIKVILFTKVSLDVDAGYDEGMGAKKEGTKDDWTVRGGVGMLRIFTKETEDHLSLNPTFFKIQKHKILTPVNLEKRRWFHLLLCL